MVGKPAVPTQFYLVFNYIYYNIKPFLFLVVLGSFSNFSNVVPFSFFTLEICAILVFLGPMQEKCLASCF